jgi:chromosome segregation ATPase
MLLIAAFFSHGGWLKKRDKEKLDELASRVTTLESITITHEEARRIAQDEIMSLEKETKVLEREISALKVSIDSLKELITLLRIELAAISKK